MHCVLPYPFQILSIVLKKRRKEKNDTNSIPERYEMVHGTFGEKRDDPVKYGTPVNLHVLSIPSPFDNLLWGILITKDRQLCTPCNSGIKSIRCKSSASHDLKGTTC